MGTSVDEQEWLEQGHGSSALQAEEEVPKKGGSQVRYRIAILALAALYFGFPPAHVGEKNARQATPEHAPATAEQPLLQSL